MGAAKKLTLSELRTAMNRFDKKELVEFVALMYKSCPDACNYMNFELGNDAYESVLLEETREKVRLGFYTKRGKAKLNLSAAKDAIERFGSYCRKTEHVLDLQISFIEYAVQIAVNYIRLPASFFRDTESMLRTVVSSLNQSNDQHLYQTFEARLNGIINDSRFADGGLHCSLESIMSSIKWLKPEEANVPDETSPDHISSKATATEILSPEDSDLFYKLWMPLLDYINSKNKISTIKQFENASSLDPAEVKKVADALWKEPALIDKYLTEKGSVFSEDERYIINGWKKPIQGKFILERHLKKGSIFISIDNGKIYLVRGTKSSWEEMLWMFPMPILLDVTLIPFRDVIISDGLNYPLQIHIGGNMSKEFKKQYMEAKRGGQIIETLM